MPTIYSSPTREFSYIKISELEKKFQEPFRKWMYGQTRPIIEGIDDAVYCWDYDRWLDWLLTGKEPIWD